MKLITIPPGVKTVAAGSVDFIFCIKQNPQDFLHQ